MIKRFNNYMLNSCKVAILGFCWAILFHVPYDRLLDAPLGGKIIAAVMGWAIWSFMVLIVANEIGNGKH